MKLPTHQQVKELGQRLFSGVEVYGPGIVKAVYRKRQVAAGLTPKGKLMPQTREEFQYMGDLYERAFFEMMRENGKLRGKINQLEQKVESLIRRGQ